MLILIGSPILVFAQPVIQPFTFSTLAHDLPMVRHGSLSWGDIDGDGDFDLFLSGETTSGLVSGIYENHGLAGDGSAHFIALPYPIGTVVYSFSSWADFDGDGDLDLLVAGSSTLTHPYSPSTKLYRNDGNAFVDTGVNFPGLHSGSSSWGDIDRDGDLDVILTGASASDGVVTVLAQNNGGGQFQMIVDALPAIGYGDSALGYMDKDGDLDVILSGSSAGGFHTRLYLNNAGQFTDTGQELGSFAFSSVELGDYDGDSDLDLIVGGGEISASLMDGQVRLWNNNAGALSSVSHSFEGVVAGDITWGDYDNDGDLDVLFLGAVTVLGRRNARIYRNDGGNTFFNSTNLIGSVFSDVEWGDFDADGDLDLLSSGYTPYGQSTTNIYLNQRQIRPTIPSTPRLLESTVGEGAVALRWSHAAETDPSNSMVSYNVRVGTEPGLSNVVSAMADGRTGKLRSPQPGNASVFPQFSLENLSEGTYYWSVQSVNNALIASTFASEGSFSISNSFVTDTVVDTQLPSVFALKSVYPNPFSSSSNIEFDLPEPVSVTLRVYSILGQEVSRLSEGILSAGTHRLEWRGTDSHGQKVSSGVYFFELRAGSSTKTGSVTLVR